MIRYRNKVFEEYFIDPVTAVITDKDGNIQQTKFCDKYLTFNRMCVHCIQAHTAWGYKKGYHVHHIDENKLNNALSNLMYVTRAEHNTIHKKGKCLSEEIKQKMREAMKLCPSFLGKHHSEESRKKMSDAHKRFCSSEEVRRHFSEMNKELHWWNNGVVTKRSKEWPGDGWTKGRLPL